jgi:hypothetical protein
MSIFVDFVFLAFSSSLGEQLLLPVLFPAVSIAVQLASDLSSEDRRSTSGRGALLFPFLPSLLPSLHSLRLGYVPSFHSTPSLPSTHSTPLTAPLTRSRFLLNPHPVNLSLNSQWPPDKEEVRLAKVAKASLRTRTLERGRRSRVGARRQGCRCVLFFLRLCGRG